MTYKRFEELPVWNDAIELAVRVFALTETGRLRTYSGLKDQIERAVVSISNNIAEGFERGTTSELLSFLYIARGLAGEVRSMLCLLARLSSQEQFAGEIRGLIARSESISRQLGRWMEALKDSGFEGTRSRNTRARAATEAEHRRARFLDKLRRIRAEARPDQRPEPEQDATDS